MGASCAHGDVGSPQRRFAPPLPTPLPWLELDAAARIRVLCPLTFISTAQDLPVCRPHTLCAAGAASGFSVGIRTTETMIWPLLSFVSPGLTKQQRKLSHNNNNGGSSSACDMCGGSSEYSEQLLTVTLNGV